MSKPKNANGMRRSRGDKITCAVVLTVVTIFILFPFFWMIKTSLSPASEVMLSPPLWLPSRLAWENYRLVWSSIPLFKYLGNSMLPDWERFWVWRCPHPLHFRWPVSEAKFEFPLWCCFCLRS